MCGGWFVFSLKSRPNVSINVSLYLIGRGHGCDIQPLSPGSRGTREVGGSRTLLECQLCSAPLASRAFPLVTVALPQVTVLRGVTLSTRIQWGRA